MLGSCKANVRRFSTLTPGGCIPFYVLWKALSVVTVRCGSWNHACQCHTHGFFCGSQSNISPSEPTFGGLGASLVLNSTIQYCKSATPSQGWCHVLTVPAVRDKRLTTARANSAQRRGPIETNPAASRFAL
jgi:hypothetical protein